MFYNLFLKIFLILNLTLFSIYSLFINDLMMMWFFMEINNFMYICLLCLKIFNKKMIFLYFLIQTSSSLIMIFTIMLNFYFFEFLYFKLILMTALSMKLGIPPFHMWMPLISKFMNWDSLLILLSIQKLTPLYMISTLEIPYFIMFLLIMMASYLSTFKMMNLLNFKLIITFSSINQTSWMLLLMLFKNLFWLFYFILYSSILSMIHITFLYLKFSSNFMINISNYNIQLMMISLFFNLSGLPPFSFFFMKWMSMYMFLFNSNHFLIFILMLLNSFILIYIYLNISLHLMFFFSITSKLIMMNPFKMFLWKITLMMMTSLFSSLIMIMM
uniref:NADH-ubiquinone oxidoreductase chain 2 n=1 Tax=Colobopsis nipponica TaxID=2681982 RepID=A0A7S7BJ56_9HYME|nr:NADH dehydrogenase subunit 2 [Colobopsis nipponica]QOW83441.1 NADH dehydrogenase subunit 2 [Colobopsis nipponica]